MTQYQDTPAVAVGETITANIGHLRRREVRVHGVAREEWLTMVRDVVAEVAEDCGDDWNTPDSGELEGRLLDELLPVAETMDRFPLGQWIAPDRGCGCLVGEYLVADRVLIEHAAHQEIRARFARFDRQPGDEDDLPDENEDRLDVESTLRRTHPDIGRSLVEVGYRIDRRVRAHLLEEGVDVDHHHLPLSAVFVD